VKDSADREEYSLVRQVGLIGGGLLFVVLLIVPPLPGLSGSGARTAAVAALMAVWWMTEAIPIPVTAMLPLVLMPALGILPMPETAAPYAHELIFLFLGGFLIAAALEQWGLHLRIALSIVHVVGTSPRRLVLGFMIATAFLSMWISNTATAAMMLPIAVALGEVLQPTDRSSGADSRFGIALMLGVAYSASIGGVATLIGTPPNAILAGAASELLGVEIGFLEWMVVGVPLAIVLLPLAWFLLVGILYPPGDVTGDAHVVLEARRVALGPASRGEKIVAAVFALTAAAWIMRSPKVIGDLTIPGIQTFAPQVTDSTIAMTSAVALFLIPVRWREGRFALSWSRAREIPWGVLILFGGGLSLARAMDVSGLAGWIGGSVADMAGVPTVIVVLVVAALFVFLTEITSNTATSTMAMPIMAGVAGGLAANPLTLMSAAALAASMAFMLPVATPPNAIVFGSGYLTIGRMARAGFWLNLMAIGAITAAATLIVPLVLT
jgi:sodium-dependent dicarboxylate transporter 2/3/5